MRRGSFNACSSGGGSGGEPLIVVEESGTEEEEPGSPNEGVPMFREMSVEGQALDPYLLSPWRDTRKHSLPTPSCASGPTASQVRRLSERGESAAREAREAAFLATLCQGASQASGTGRRHSVVTISRVPQSLFGRGRRESIATFPALARRRDSGSKKCPPATDQYGSSHNVQLDIMDDILPTRRVVRMRMWDTSSERLCEVQPLDEQQASGSVSPTVRYTNRGRRHSEFTGGPLPPIPSRRRASEMPPPIPPRAGAAAALARTTTGGVICTDTDLHHMLNALTSSATEIDRIGNPDARPRLANTRSSSFDASTLRPPTADSGTSWFKKRHQTLAAKKDESGTKKNKVAFSKEKTPAGVAKVVWDSGAVVDASALGSAIEVFLRQSGTPAESAPSTSGASISGASTSAASTSAASTSRDSYQRVPEPRPSTSTTTSTNPTAQEGGERWSASRNEEEGAQGCDTALCTSIKDLFI